jgi:hypothetical protein
MRGFSWLYQNCCFAASSLVEILRISFTGVFGASFSHTLSVSRRYSGAGPLP